MMTWWNYTAYGEATQIGKAPGGVFIQFGWDALGLLKSVSDNGNSHDHRGKPQAMPGDSQSLTVTGI